MFYVISFTLTLMSVDCVKRDTILKYMNAPIEDVPLKLSTDISESFQLHKFFLHYMQKLIQHSE